MKTLFTSNLKFIYRTIFIVMIIVFSVLAYYSSISKEGTQLSKNIIQSIFIFFALLGVITIAYFPKFIFYSDRFEISSWFGFNKKTYFYQDVKSNFIKIVVDKYGRKNELIYINFKDQSQIEIPTQYYTSIPDLKRILIYDKPIDEESRANHVKNYNKVYSVLFGIIALILFVIAINLYVSNSIAIQITLKGRIENYFDNDKIIGLCTLLSLVLLLLYLSFQKLIK